MKALWAQLQSISIGDKVNCSFVDAPVWMTVHTIRVDQEGDYIINGRDPNGIEEMVCGPADLSVLVIAKGDRPK